MTEICPEIYLADLIRALHTLEPNKDSLEYVVSMLGFELDQKILKSSPEPEKPRKLLPHHEPIMIEKPKITRDILTSVSMNTVEENELTENSLPTMPEPLKDNSEENEPLPEYHPLFIPIWTRAIITKLLSIEVDEGLPDIQKMIKIISENKPLRQIPRKAYPTLRRGVHILIDIGPGLVPYIRDQVSLLELLKYIVGIDRIEVWDFIGTPLKYSAFHDELIESYRLPPPGTPILMLTDLGIATPPFATENTSVDEWTEFAQHVHAAGCSLLALTPYNSTRWPKALKDQMIIVQWDRETTVSTVSKFLKKSQR
jgi:hypothetical protein